MTRAGLGYVSMAAAGLSAVVLVYAVIWSYSEPEAPPAVLSAPSVQEAPPSAMIPQNAAPEISVAVPPARQPSGEAAALVSANPSIAAPMRDAPADLARAAEATPPPLERSAVGKPEVVPAPKDAQIAVAPVKPTVASPKAEASAALLSTDRPQASSRPLKPPAQQAAKAEIAEPPPQARSAPKGKGDVQGLQASEAPPRESAAVAPPPKQDTGSPRAAVSAQEEAVAQRPFPSAESMPVQPPTATRLAAATPASQRSVIAPSPSALPQPATSLQPERPPPAAPIAPPPDAVALATEEPELPSTPSLAVSPKLPDRPARTSPRGPAIPAARSSDHPAITIIRGSRRSVGRQPASKPRVPEPQKQRIAALPAGAAATRTATDAPSILVLRGARGVRYARAGVAHAPPEPLLTVIRGARPRPVLLQPYVQPNALILHIRH